MLSVFMGRTCNGSKWREELKSIEGIDWFDPVVADWNEEAKRNELVHRFRDDVLLHVVTPKMLGVLPIAEVIDDSNKHPERVLFVVKDTDEDAIFDKDVRKSLKSVKRMVMDNNATVLEWEELPTYFKNLRDECQEG